jgi:hypothetical protein
MLKKNKKDAIALLFFFFFYKNQNFVMEKGKERAKENKMLFAFNPIKTNISNQRTFFLPFSYPLIC